MKTVSLALLGLTLIACGQKPGTGSDTGGSVSDADNDGFDSSTDCDDSNPDINPEADEICDGLDNNCDGVRDEDGAVDAPNWYADSDLDTYGDPSVSLSSCEAPEGYVADSSDCNDSDPQVNPDAVEICDGIDNDCDTGTSEDGMVSYVDPSGNRVDATADVTGPPAGPQAYTLSEGELQFCDGTFYTHLLIDGDATIRSINEDPTQAILDGGGKGRTVTVSGEMMDVAIEDLTITGGAGFVDELSFDGDSAAGGGLACAGVDLEGNGDLPESFTNLTLENVLLVGNAAPLSAGLFSIYCNTTISNSEISDNDGLNVGGLVLYDGSHEFTNVDIVNNTAEAYSAGGITSLASMETTVIFDDVVVSGNNNSSSDGGPVFGLLFGVDITWTGTSGSMGSGFWGNESNGPGALELTQATTLNASTVDFGSMADGTGNLDYDIENYGIEYWVNRDDASFTCEDGACGSSTTTTILDPSSASENESNETFALGSVFTVDSLGTLDEFSLFTRSASQSCSMEYSLLSSSNPAGGNWTVEWSSTQTIGANLSWHASGTIGKVLDSSLTYALHWDTNDCFYDLSWSTNSTTPVSLTGLGEATNAYILGCEEEINFVGDTVTCFYVDSNPVHFSLRVDVTEL